MVMIGVGVDSGGRSGVCWMGLECAEEKQTAVPVASAAALWSWGHPLCGCVAEHRIRCPGQTTGLMRCCEAPPQAQRVDAAPCSHTRRYLQCIFAHHISAPHPPALDLLQRPHGCNMVWKSRTWSVFNRVTRPAAHSRRTQWRQISSGCTVVVQRSLLESDGMWSRAQGRGREG